jgi:hypothetical protein
VRAERKRLPENFVAAHVRTTALSLDIKQKQEKPKFGSYRSGFHFDMLATQQLRLLVGVCVVTCVVAETGDDFSNNLFTDLAP